MRSRQCFLWAYVFSLTLSSLSTLGAEPQLDLPRYRLEVGQEVRYSGHDDFTFDSGVFSNDYSWRIWVVRQNENASWRLVLRYGRLEKDNRPSARGRERETASFAWCDLDAVGRLPENDSFGYLLNPYSLLVRLPDDRAALTAGWPGTPRQLLGESSRLRWLSEQATDTTAVIEMVREDPINAIYGFEFKDTIQFDRRRGLPQQIDSFTKQTYGFVGTGKGSLKLDEVMSHDAAWARDFWTDAERYFAASQSLREAQRTKDQNGPRLEATFQAAIDKLQATKEEIKSPELKKQIDHEIGQHRELATHYLERANSRTVLLSRPAVEWSCQDFAGKEHSLKDYRGQVVVLDFWYRGCGWCVRSMPQLKQVVSRFAGQPVTVLGMNTDRDEEDARFVMEKIELNYTNLKAHDVPKKYSVQGFPTLLIIDQEGILRDIHIGYSPKLKEEVVAAIERLLKKN